MINISYRLCEYRNTDYWVGDIRVGLLFNSRGIKPVPVIYKKKCRYLIYCGRHASRITFIR